MHELTRETTQGQPPKNGRPDGRAARWRRGLLRLACAAMLCMAAAHSAGLPRQAGAEAVTLSETQVKALFLLNFTKYVNTTTAGASRLKLSAKLLGVADVVQYKP